jgi:WD40 repeat protein
MSLTGKIMTPDGAPGCAFSPDGSRLIAGSEEGFVVREVETGAVLATLKTTDRDCAFSPDGCYILTRKHSSTMLWDAKTYEEICLISQTSKVLARAFSPMSRRLAFIGWRGLCFLDIGTEPQSTVSNSEIGQAVDYDWSPDASLIVIGCANGGLKLWDVAREKITMSFSENSAEITACAFSPDGTLVGTITKTGTVMLWDIASTEKIAEFWSGARLSHLEWSADGNHLLVEVRRRKCIFAARKQRDGLSSVAL